MNFYEYMMEHYLGKDTAKGDLAGDMRHEEGSFPKDGGHDEIRRYLVRRRACRECLQVFERCWKEYTRSK